MKDLARSRNEMVSGRGTRSLYPRLRAEMTRRGFLQAIPGVLPVCRTSELPPSLSLTFEEYEQLDSRLMAEILRTPDLEVAGNKARAILRAAVREVGPQVNKR